MSKLFYFKQFSLAYLHILAQLPIDRTISGATNPGQSETGSDSNKVIRRIPQRSSFTDTSPSDCLVSYRGHFLVGWGGVGVIPLWRDAVCVFYSPSRLGHEEDDEIEKEDLNCRYQ